MKKTSESKPTGKFALVVLIFFFLLIFVLVPLMQYIFLNPTRIETRDVKPYIIQPATDTQDEALDQF